MCHRTPFSSLDIGGGEGRGGAGRDAFWVVGGDVEENKYL
jgi:hypothetical protein